MAPRHKLSWYPPFENRKGWGNLICGGTKGERLGQPPNLICCGTKGERLGQPPTTESLGFQFILPLGSRMTTLRSALVALALTCSFISAVLSGPLCRPGLASQRGGTPGSSDSDIASCRQQLIEDLPSCSVLRADLELKISGDDVDLPYMEQMRQRS